MQIEYRSDPIEPKPVDTVLLNVPSEIGEKKAKHLYTTWRNQRSLNLITDVHPKRGRGRRQRERERERGGREEERSTD